MSRIVADSRIPFLRGVFEAHGVQVEYAEGADIRPDLVRSADALVVRTRTRCDRQLLEGSTVGMIATATIGYDHIDTDYCATQGIRVLTSAGCNARGVAQYVMGALVALDVRPPAVLGVVGVGNVGSVVCAVAESLGYTVLRNDPPRQARGDRELFFELDEVVGRADVLTLHVPLDESTRGMVDARLLSAAKPGIVFINSSRGEVVDQTALMEALSDGRVSHAVLDVWCNEPQIDRDLLDMVTIATPHIAGYSLQGKAMGTAMAVRAVADFLGIEALREWYPSDQVAPAIPCEKLSWNTLVEGLQSNYDILTDSVRLKTAPQNFEIIRSTYHYRNEFF